MSSSPAFGEADLTNCERELIHLAGSIQPHGLLLVVRPADLAILQASHSAGALLGRPLDALLASLLPALGGDLAPRVREAMADAPAGEPQPLRCRLGSDGAVATYDGAVHATASGLWVIELEPHDPNDPLRPSPRDERTTPHAGPQPAAFELPHPLLEQGLGQALQRIGEAATLGALADAVTRSVRDLVGYDRVMVYQFDADGHGKIIAEARDPRLEPLLGHHYPASDIPQRARELYLRNRVRVLVDVDYEPSPLVPRALPAGDGHAGGELDMSMCYLRSMSPLHLQYLRNMGVTATLVVSLIREGQLWGLIACHHYRPRNLHYTLRAACDLLGAVVSTRIAAIENYAHAQVAIQVRRLQQRLIEATSTEGDWRLALFRNPRTLLQPLDATGAVLFHGGELLTCGEVPSTPELRALIDWVRTQPDAGPQVAVATSSIRRAHPPLESLTPTASGVLAVRLSAGQPDYLLWLRKEQLQTVTWAGDPTKPVISNDPLTLSPRRSFAAWSEIVRGTALPWTSSDLAMAGALGDALVDIIAQVNAVRLLIAEHQLAQVRSTIAASKEAVAVAGTADGSCHANDALLALAGRPQAGLRTTVELAALFTDRQAALQMMDFVRSERRPWRGELALALPGGGRRMVRVRAEPVPARDGSLLGFILMFDDLTQTRQAREARAHLEDALASASRRLAEAGSGERNDLVAAIFANASLAAMDIADAGAAASAVPLLREVEAAATLATTLVQRIRRFARDET